jgi:5-methylcytosine-specific restriction endonuclease McrA
MTRDEEIELAWQQHNDWRYRLGANTGLTPALRERLSEAQNWRCCYCGDRMDGQKNDPNAPTFEHVVPKSQGGSNEEDNLVIACQRCNNRRGSEMAGIDR